MNKLDYQFFKQSSPTVAHDLIGKVMVFKNKKYRITETEAYDGSCDTASHAHKGRTKRTEVMFWCGGTIYVYLCYGIHHLLNFVTGDIDEPQAVLIRAIEGIYGPGRLTKHMGIDKSYYAKDVYSEDFYIVDDGYQANVLADKRIGIGYASKKDQARLWRFYDERIQNNLKSR